MTRQFWLTMLAGLLTCVFAASPLALAKDKNPDKPLSGKMDALFKQLDKDKDGKLSKTEFASLPEVWKEKPAEMPSTDTLFKTLDGNFDGSLTLDELNKIDGAIKKLTKKKKKT